MQRLPASRGFLHGRGLVVPGQQAASSSAPLEAARHRLRSRFANKFGASTSSSPAMINITGLSGTIGAPAAAPSLEAARGRLRDRFSSKFGDDAAAQADVPAALRRLDARVTALAARTTQPRLPTRADVPSSRDDQREQERLASPLEAARGRLRGRFLSRWSGTPQMLEQLDARVEAHAHASDHRRASAPGLSVRLNPTAAEDDATTMVEEEMEPIPSFVYASPAQSSTSSADSQRARV